MKFLAVILSVYVFCLTIMPCVDGLAADLIPGPEVIHNEAASQQQECGHCSPFCTCDCCASQVLTKENLINFEYSTISEKFITFYTPDYHSSSYFFIWHPPKIG
jgi:hypothetical protein